MCEKIIPQYFYLKILLKIYLKIFLFRDFIYLLIKFYYLKTFNSLSPFFSLFLSLCLSFVIAYLTTKNYWSFNAFIKE